jgi:hypothetical protein
MNHEMDVDLRDLSLSGFEFLPELEAELNGFAAQARAERTRAAVHMRRASSERILSEILPPKIESGDAWHVLSSGDVDALSFLAHLLDAVPMDYVLLSTWCMALPDVDQIREWIDGGRITRLDAYVGEIFPGSYSAEHVALCDVVRNCGGRVAVFRNHSKVFLCCADDLYWVVESSANINTNPRTENTVITASESLFWHHKEYFDGIKSFERNFDGWEKWLKA